MGHGMVIGENRGIHGYGSVMESTLPDKWGCVYIKHGNYVRLIIDAGRGTEAWEKWVIHSGCLEQANNGNNEGGCEACNPEDYELDFCPWKKEEN